VLELAASSSVPDCEYSLVLVSIESLSWLSLRGKKGEGVAVKHRYERTDGLVDGCWVCVAVRREKARWSMRREVWQRNIAVDVELRVSVVIEGNQLDHVEGDQ